MSIPYNLQNLKGTGQKLLSMPTLSPEQQQIFSSLTGGIQPGIGKDLGFMRGLASGDPSFFSQMEAPAMRQFEQMMGQMGSRFSGMGSEGARDSSAFNIAGTSAGVDLAERLQANRLGMQQGAVKDLLGFSERLMQTPTSNQMLMQKQQKTPWWHPLVGLAGTGIKAGVSALL